MSHLFAEGKASKTQRGPQRYIMLWPALSGRAANALGFVARFLDLLCVCGAGVHIGGLGGTIVDLRKG